MRKRRILAVLLAVSMVMGSTAVASAEEGLYAGAANTVESGTEPETKETAGGGSDTLSGEEDGAEHEDKTPAEDTSAEAGPEKPGENGGQESGEGEEQEAEDTSQKPGEDGEQTPTGDAEQKPDGNTEQSPEETDGEAGENTAGEEEPVLQPEEILTGEEAPDAAQVMNAEAQAEGEIVQGGKDWEITNLSLRQEYGMIGLSWGCKALDTANDPQQYYKLYRSEDINGPWNEDTLLMQTENTDTCSYEDKSVRKEGTVINDVYYYGVSLVYQQAIIEDGVITGRELRETVPEVVSNEDAYYCASGYPYPGAPTTYIGAYITDDAGKRLDSLTIKEGEPVSLRVNGVKADKEAVRLEDDNSYTGWYLCKRYYTSKELGETHQDQLERLQDGTEVNFIREVVDWEEEKTNDLHVDMTALPGTARAEDYYLVLQTAGSDIGQFVWQIPVRIEEGDGSYTPPAESGGVYLTKEGLCQAIRDTMVKREDTVLYAIGGYEWWDVSTDPSVPDMDFEDVFDFHRERQGMKPNEGDYLLLAIGDANSVVYFGEWLKMESSSIAFNNQYLTKYTITPSFITTKEQEDKVDQKIQEIVHQEGGALYNYRNASDYEKIKAAYDYVRKHVSYIGTTTPIYHTCYSALINQKATCQGYALLFYRLARELGIPCRVLMGTDANAHTYNIVRLGNEDVWYYVDTNAGVLLKGTNDFKPATLQSQYRTESFKAEYISKISKTSYGGGEENISRLESVTSLNNEEIAKISSNLTGVEEDMKAVYTISGASIKASGTVRYKEGCSGYLGCPADTSAGGYFLALKIKAGAGFTDHGTINISYLDESGARQEKSYAKADLTEGALHLLVNVTKDPGLKISVDYDSDEEASSKFDAMLYDLDISGLKRESQEKSSGEVKDVQAYGIEPSAPIVKKSDGGKKIEVTYDAVAYSDEVSLPGLAESEKQGNYIVLELAMPDAVKGTKLADTVTIEQENTEGQTQTALQPGWNISTKCYVEMEPLKKSWIRLAMPVTMPVMKKFVIKWGDVKPLEQQLFVIVPDGGRLETRSETALLPGSIAFNGLISNMFVGQNQNIHITFKKKYEADEIQVYYTSDASDVLSVNRITGVMKALKPGTANITVTAVDKYKNKIDKKARVTIKELPAPTGIKVASVKDTGVTVSWKANTTGTATEVYAIPYSSSNFDPKKKKEWKNVVENAMTEAGLAGETLADLEKGSTDTDQKKDKALEALGSCFGTGSCVALSVPASEGSSADLKGLQPETEYIFYVRNVSKTAASTVAFTGVTTDKQTKTKSLIFDSIRMAVTTPPGSVITSAAEDGIPVYTVKGDGLRETVSLSYEFLDSEGTKLNAEPEFKNVKFISSNKNIVKTGAPKDGSSVLTFGTQVGDAKITVTGKDASGTLRESEPVIIRVVRTPSQLKDKAITLTIGQSLSITELIATDLKGTTEGMDLAGNIDFAAAVTAVEKTGLFELSYPAGASKETAPQTAVVTAKALVDGKSGNKVEIPFTMGSITAKAKIQIKDMAAASIGKITVKDTSAEIGFKPSVSVLDLEDARYGYKLVVRDKVTGNEQEVDITDGIEGQQDMIRENVSDHLSCQFKSTEGTKAWSCEVKGLSSNKAYEAVVNAYYKPAGEGNEAAVSSSKPKKFTTKKPLLASAGSISVNYISLDELRKNPTNDGTKVDYDDENGVLLENNGTYVFMAQISNLARTLETDKLKWAISSGDKKAASIKVSSSSYEMQLTTSRTGIFTVTAVSTVTKEPVVTFKVEVIPYQSGGAGASQPSNPTPDTTALLPEVYMGDLLKSKREDAA